MSEVNLDQERAIALAKEQDYKVYRGRPNRLLIDLDGKLDSYFWNRVSFVRSFLSIVEYKRWQSKSGNWHIIFKMNRDLDVPERSLLQVILGSDQEREMYCLARFWEGQEEPSMLFRPPTSPPVAKPKKSIVRRKPVEVDLDDDIPF